MNFILVALLAVTFQFLMNKISKKISYAYSNKSEFLAIGISVVLWILEYNRFGFAPTFFILALTESILVSSSLIDLKYQEIPNSYNLAVALLGGVFILLYHQHYQQLLLGGIISFVLFMVIMIVTKAMGGGDVKMAGAIGLFLGYGLLPNFVSVAFLVGALEGIILLIFKHKGKKDLFAFGPCIAFSFIYLVIRLF